MREIELKLVLDEAQERRLRASPVLKSHGVSEAKTQNLTSQYFDTDADTLREQGIALRLRKAGRQWLQTVKKVTQPMAQGLSQPLEDECVLPDDNLNLSLIQDDDLREDVIGIARKGLHVVAETDFRRTSRQLRTPSGGVVELAIDKGALRSGDWEEAFIETELELIDGNAGDLYALAALLFPKGPVRFSALSKSDRALALSGKVKMPPEPRKAVKVVLPSAATIEGAAIQILSEGLSHYLPNLPLLLETDNPGGPHQVRVALRRLRSALSAFRGPLGRDVLATWAIHARDIAAAAGRLRDLDVLGEELLQPMADENPGEPGFAALVQAVAKRRERVQAEVRRDLSGPEVTAFGFDMAGFIATRGWLDPSDHQQSARLAAPVAPFVQKALNKRWKAVRSYGNRIESLTIDERHELRKELKKLRYLADAFRSVFESNRVEEFIRLIKKLQVAFGALNDSAMAEEILTAPDAPGSDDPMAARAAGRVIGHLLAEADHQWPGAIAGWRDLAAYGPFWKN
ncbi:MAG: CYTH and CHAD domain-containing protein [Pseudomonadota bacterium]